jgi:hypothetical protein
VFETVPRDADQVTAIFDVLVTRAVNCAVPADGTVTAAGVTVTLTAGDTMTWKEWVPDCELRSAAETTKLKVPVLLGVPEIIPVV